MKPLFFRVDSPVYTAIMSSPSPLTFKFIISTKNHDNIVVILSVPLEIPLSSIRYKITLHTMKVSTKKNDGVSPVIGTILLVAITVVLVAIISAVVMGMTGDIGSSYVVGVKVTQNATDAGNALITITGGQNAADLKAFYVYNGTSSTPVGTTSNPVVGVPYNYNIGTGQVALSIVGNFADGSNQTIYTATVNY